MNWTCMSNTVAIIKRWISQSGRPKALWSDNGPGFYSHYESMGIEVIKAALYCQNHNGRAENAEHKPKKLMMKTNTSGEIFEVAIRAWNDSPRCDSLDTPLDIFDR